MITFKFILLAICCVTLAKAYDDDLSEKERKKQFTEDFLACNAYYDVELKNFRSNIELIKLAEKQNKKCWRKCYFEAIGMINADGDFDIEHLRNHVIKLSAGNPKVINNAKAIVKTCIEATFPKNPCISVPLRINCITKYVLDIRKSLKRPNKSNGYKSEDGELALDTYGEAPNEAEFSQARRQATPNAFRYLQSRGGKPQFRVPAFYGSPQRRGEFLYRKPNKNIRIQQRGGVILPNQYIPPKQQQPLNQYRLIQQAPNQYRPMQPRGRVQFRTAPNQYRPIQQRGRSLFGASPNLFIPPQQQQPQNPYRPMQPRGGVPYRAPPNLNLSLQQQQKPPNQFRHVQPRSGVPYRLPQQQQQPNQYLPIQARGELLYRQSQQQRPPNQYRPPQLQQQQPQLPNQNSLFYRPPQLQQLFPSRTPQQQQQQQQQPLDQYRQPQQLRNLNQYRPPQQLYQPNQNRLKQITPNQYRQLRPQQIQQQVQQELQQQLQLHQQNLQQLQFNQRKLQLQQQQLLQQRKQPQINTQQSSAPAATSEEPPKKPTAELTKELSTKPAKETPIKAPKKQ